MITNDAQQRQSRIRARLEAYSSRLRDIGTLAWDTELSRMAGYAYGYAEASLKVGDLDAA
ncbi:hypothetical protein [Streptomyces gardneri]|uniref:hypothetical protein n=1 Tax=Streptomyces gardneri TaxID=66892 RepID=UPI0037D3D740